MKWILKMHHIGAHASVVAVEPPGELHSLQVSKMRGEELVPSGSIVRRVFEGSWENWAPGSAEPFLGALGIQHQYWCENRHRVFQASVNGQSWHLPALPVLRAMCGRGADVLSRVFVPSGLDDLVLMDYRVTPPQPVIVENTPFAANLSSTEKLFLRWLAGSISATNAFNSALTNALQGKLEFPLPQGEVKFSARGVESNGSFFVGSIEIAEVTVMPSDSLDGMPTRHVLAPRALKGELKLPYGAHGDAPTTDHEWDLLWPILRTRFNEHRESEIRRMLNCILEKYVFGYRWNELDEDPRSHLTNWKHDGRWNYVLEVLAITREGNEKYAPHVLRHQRVFMF